MPDGPLQGRDPVNGEFEVGYNDRSEHRWASAERAGCVITVVCVAAGLVGCSAAGRSATAPSLFPGAALSADDKPITGF